MKSESRNREMMQPNSQNQIEQHISSRISFRAFYRFSFHSKSFKEFKPLRNTNVFCRFCWSLLRYEYAIVLFTPSHSFSNRTKVVMPNGHLTIRWIPMELKSNENVHFIRFGSVTHRIDACALCEAAQSRNFGSEFNEMEKLHQFSLNHFPFPKSYHAWSPLFC